MSAAGWELWVSITTVAVNISLLLAAIVAVIKLRVFNLLSYRYRSEVECSHIALSSGKILFLGNYTIRNTGERPFDISAIELRLVGVRLEGKILRPDYGRVLAEHRMGDVESGMKGLFRIEAGERTIFPLQAELDELDELVFLACRFRWPYGREPAPYIALYAPGGG